MKNKKLKKFKLSIDELIPIHKILPKASDVITFEKFKKKSVKKNFHKDLNFTDILLSYYFSSNVVNKRLKKYTINKLR